jgi:hypothetical protein
MNDFGICRPYGAGELFVAAVSTKMSLLTELGATGKPAGPSLYHLLEVLGKKNRLQVLIKRLVNSKAHALLQA